MNQNLKHIGFIGLGKMGVPMAQNLIQAGYQLSVYNRTTSKADGLVAQGALLASNLPALVDFADVIIVMVADDDAIRAIFLGEDGILAGIVNGKTIINMSTVSPSISREMAELLQGKGCHYLDAPISGSLKQATEATLVIMAGGDEHVFEEVRPILTTMGKLALRVGEVGAGNAAKLAINALLSFHALGLAEAVTFAKNQGIKTADLLELVNNSALGNAFMKIKGEAILENNFSPVFALKHIVKDLRLAADEGLDSSLANASLNSFIKAEATLGEEDIISVIRSF